PGGSRQLEGERFDPLLESTRRLCVTAPARSGIVVSSLPSQQNPPPGSRGGRTAQRLCALCQGQAETTTLTVRACGPFGPSSTSYSTFAPSARLLYPSPLIALWWTKTSLPPSSCVMKP